MMFNPSLSHKGLETVNIKLEEMIHRAVIYTETESIYIENLQTLKMFGIVFRSG